MKLLCACACVLGSSGLVSAQGVTDDPPDPRIGYRDSSRGFVSGFGGVTFGTEPDRAFGGLFGVNLGPHLQVVGEVGRLFNVLPKSIQAPLTDLSLVLSELTDQDIRLNAKAPLTYGLAGLRVLVPLHSRVRPYVTGGLGWGSVRPEIRFELDEEDVTDDLLEGDILNPSDVHSDRVNKLVYAGGAGLNIWFPSNGGEVWARHVEGVLDLGYQYLSLTDTAVPFRVHRVYLAIGLAF